MKRLRSNQHEHHGIGPLFDLLQNASQKGSQFIETKYPNAPGYKRAGTSKDAAEEMEGKASKLRNVCLHYLRQVSSTADEVAIAFRMSVLAIRPRISELVARGKIEDSGLRRRNVSGKSAIVWRVK